ncbi:hypothetical protein WCLP8_5470001 [uncultured Gammaproteobacteria bacterium]
MDAEPVQAGKVETAGPVAAQVEAQADAGSGQEAAPSAPTDTTSATAGNQTQDAAAADVDRRPTKEDAEPVQAG